MSKSNLKNRNMSTLSSDFKTDEDFSELFQSSKKNEVKEGSVITGTIVGFDKNEFVIVDVSLKNEGYIPLKEFEYDIKNGLDLSIGDKVDVFVEKLETHNGRTILSREKAVKEEYWFTLEKLMSNKETVDGIIFGKVKGGFTVDLNGIIAFLPGSQVDVKLVKDITPLMNIVQPFYILKIDREQGNIVVSRRAILEESRNEARNELLSHIKEGQILDGVVKNITDYGAFVDLGNLDGLLHVTDISWGRISHPSEVLTLGQEIKVLVIKYNDDTKRISLGMKQLEDNPWKQIEARFPKGEKFKGKVTNIADYGAFIELEPGIEGLVHISEISWTKNNVHPKKILSPGQDVEFMVLDIDASKHRISLGMKQCNDNPWANFAAKNAVGSVVEGLVKNIVDFGLFVGFEGEIDGLVHISDISCGEGNAANAAELKKFKKDDLVKVKVLSVDVNKERISLGMKQLASDNFSDNTKNIKKGDIITCIVKEVQKDGLDLETTDGLGGFIKRIDLSNDKAEQRTERFAVGDRLDAKVISLDKNNQRLFLSIKALEIDEQKKAIAEYGSTDSGASLGDILGAAFSSKSMAASATKKLSSSDEDANE